MHRREHRQDDEPRQHAITHQPPEEANREGAIRMAAGKRERESELLAHCPIFMAEADLLKRRKITPMGKERANKMMTIKCKFSVAHWRV